MSSTESERVVWCYVGSAVHRRASEANSKHHISLDPNNVTRVTFKKSKYFSIQRGDYVTGMNQSYFSFRSIVDASFRLKKAFKLNKEVSLESFR